MENSAPLATSPKHQGNPFLRISALLLFAFSVAAFSSLITYYFLNQQLQKQLQSIQEKNQVSTAQTLPASPSASTIQDETVNWQTYTSKLGGLKFKYPSDWKLNSYGDEKYSENITATSPQGLKLNYYYGPVQGLTVCDPGPDCPKITNYKVIPFSIPGYKTVYLVQGSFDYQDIFGHKGVYLSELNQPDKAIVAGGGTGFNNNIKSKNKPDMSFSFEGSWDPNTPQEKLSEKQYFELPDVKTAEKILRTVSY